MIHWNIKTQILPLCIVIGFLLASVTTPIRAQVFGPGELSIPHQQLDSLTGCQKCHSSEKKIDRTKCLSCHRPLAVRIKQQKGFHGQKKVQTAACENCHPEHRGKTTPLINWKHSENPESSRKGQEAFNHAATGWPLHGTHSKIKCLSCHQSRLVRDKTVLEYLRAHPNATTFQGLSTRCIDCHFDEHRGQLQYRCEKCHNETAFSPATKFNHDSYWKLAGAHKNTECIKCHPAQHDPQYLENQFPKPKSVTYLKMTSIAHTECIDCHRDPHQNRFGKNCLSCHNMEKWLIELPPDDLTFHNRTSFPLLGRHRFVPCEHCHPRDAHGKMKQKPIAHNRCNTCHPNAHPDLSSSPRLDRDCKYCHDNNGFSPSRFTLQNHQKSRFPLTSAHQSVACSNCHTSKMGPPIKLNGAQNITGFTAQKVQSPWRLRSDAAADSCQSCHQSPHRNQFTNTPCTQCHANSTWRINISEWNHGKHSRYQLRGRHLNVPCAECHKVEADLEGDFIRYRPIQHTDCLACHSDQHLGQFQYLSPNKKCKDCHNESGFRPALFDHNNSKMSSFPLVGPHRTAKCIQCHPRVTLANNVTVIRYRPTVADCDLCHEDEHQGAFKEMSQNLPKQPISFQSTADTVPVTDLWSTPQNWFPTVKERTNCRACHQESQWHNVAFDHNQTEFPLKGRHYQVLCSKCHSQNIQTKIPTDCSGCHEDAHKGSLGKKCESCHNENGFSHTTPNMYAQHNRTQFPLVGRHAALPCTECHRDASSREFKKVPTDCIACHANDVPAFNATFIDHRDVRASCDRCHTAVSWKTAAFEGHDRCFPIGTFTKHGAVSCKKCHQGNPPARLTNCTSGNFSCIQCHGCQTSRHQGVTGYSCEDERCYRCHRHP